MKTNSLKNRINIAIDKVNRFYFMLPEYQSVAKVDMASPIGHEQTISQPTTVQHMLTWLDVLPGQKVLDVGYGSGWSSALLSYLVGNEGQIFSTERIPELKDFGEDNCNHYQCENIKFFLSTKVLGLPYIAPFDRILVSAAADSEIPITLIDQLAPGGKLVIPVNNSIFELKKDELGNIDYINEHIGYTFVPLIFK